MESRPNPLSRIVKLVISMVYFACLMLERVLLRLVGRTPISTCIVLYYHSIPAEQRDAFARQMDMVARLTTPIDVEHPPTLIPGRYYSAITFDDGFQDAVENAVPELVRRGIHATFFVTVGALGKQADWWPEPAQERTRNIATGEHFQSMPRKWIGIGAHTMTHPRLASLLEADARYEILEPRRRLEAVLGYAIKSFSFPYGDFDASTIRWCREAGYDRTFTTQHKRAFESPGSFVVGRVKADATDWRLEFVLKLLGGYVWLPCAIDLKRKLRSNKIVNKGIHA